MFSGLLTAGCLPGGLLFVADAVSHPKQWSAVIRNTVILMNVEVPTHYLLSQNTESLFLKYVSIAKTKCFGNQCFTVTEMLWVTLESVLKDNNPTPMFHSQLCCQSIRFLYFTLYKEAQLKSKLQNMWTWSTAAWLPCHLCYRPEAFFYHPSHFAYNYTTICQFFFFFNFWNIK